MDAFIALSCCPLPESRVIFCQEGVPVLTAFPARTKLRLLLCTYKGVPRGKRLFPGAQFAKRCVSGGSAATTLRYPDLTVRRL